MQSHIPNVLLLFGLLTRYSPKILTALIAGAPTPRVVPQYDPRTLRVSFQG